MSNENTQTPAKKGRGWHGDKEGHARAGSKGGLAKGQRGRMARNQEPDQPNHTEFTNTSAAS